MQVQLNWGGALSAALCLLVFQTANAQTTTSTNHTYNDFYTISESAATSDDTTSNMNPLMAVQSFVDQNASLGELKAQVYNLLSFDHHSGLFGQTAEPYNRVKDFGTWIRDPSGQTCYNTRAEILIRDSKVQVDFTASHCTVANGDWQEPYTGQEVTKASALQIDHVVPLKNAYVSGASTWDYAKRCLYANFMGNNFHLLAADGHENMKKGDAGPEGYMPPDNNYKCQYLQHWVRIKMIWELGLNPDEVAAIQQDISTYQCDPNDFMYTAADLQAQRQFMADNANLCGHH